MSGTFYGRHIASVIERQKKRKAVLIITGPRQVGKTTILKHIMPDIKYITLDDPMLKTVATEDAFAFLAQNKPPVIIDEVQKAPSLFEYVKIAVDSEEKTAQYFFTGSHSFNLMKGVTESLAGRAGIIRMLGLSGRELSGVSYREPFKPTAGHIEAMRESEATFDYNETINIIHKGAFPELYKLETDLKDWKDYYASYLQSYLEKDIKDLIKPQNMSAFIKFIKGAAALSGEQLSLETLSEIAGMNVNTIKSWLSILETGGHIYLLQPYSNNSCKRLIKKPKLYFLDTGLICYLGGWNTPEQLLNGARWGHIYETYVISEVLKSYFNDGDLYPPLYYYRDKEKNEVDIIIEEGNTLYPVEIKTTTEPKKGHISAFNVLKKIPSKHIAEGAVICLYKNAIKLDGNNWAIPVSMI
ncbi:MAG: ATP-binding protein [Firmicutes bacterium]|nr:ATP-binding protein [Bacillota bacterium]